MSKTFTKFVLVALLFVFAKASVLSQTQQVVQNAPFGTDSVSMWGLSSDPVLDDEISLFHVDWNEGYNSGSSGIFTIVGQSFGAGFQGNISGQIGSKIRLENFTSGLVSVDYPVDVTLTMPQDNTYDQGDQVTVSTDYSVVDPNWALETVYPGGEIMWDVYFQLAASASVTVCVFGCATFPIIPSFDTGLITINLVTISSNGASTNGETGIWYLGPGMPPPASFSQQSPGINGWPYSVPISDNPTGNIFIDWIPWQCYEDLVLDFPDNDLGIFGSLTLPYVVTDDALVGQTLEACGESEYMEFGVEIFDLLGYILQQTPAAPVGLFLVNLSGEYDPLEGTPFGGLISVNWNFFSASIVMRITNKQCFTFDPIINGSFKFPYQVEYDVLNPLGNVLYSGQGDVINIEIGQQFRYKFPCFYETVNFVPTYTINGLMNNHTYDSISFSFDMSAFEFGIEMSEFIIIPGFTIPSWCFDLPYPCPTWSNPFKWCSVEVCTPEIVIPDIGFPGFQIGIGPLWEESLPIGSIEYDWFNETWSLPGFDPVIGDTVFMQASPLSIASITSNVSCFGLNDGAVDISTFAISLATPMAYTWTNGLVSEDLTGLTAGSYQVSVIDANGCQMVTGGVVVEPLDLLATAAAIDKSCNSALNNDGTINLNASGGTGILNYSWTGPGGFTSLSEDLMGLDVGAYSVTVTDVNGCTEQITATISQPPLLGQSGVVTNVNCNGGNDGLINATAFGGTGPYTFAWNNGVQTEDLSVATSGNYTLVVTDAKNCTSTQTYTVNQPSQALTLSATFTNVNCFGDSTGGINLTTAGGTPGYTFTWSNGNGIILPFVSEDLTNLPASTYTVSVTDARGCSASLSQLINQPNSPVSSLPVLDDVNCFGDASGAVNPGISGGTIPYTYSWSNTSTAPTLSNVLAGAYDLLLTDALGCQENYSFVVTQPPSALSVTLQPSPVLCFGEATGAIASQVQGGTAGYTYSWSNNTNNNNISNVPSGNYTLTVTDSKLCTATATAIVNQPLAPLTGNTVVTDVNCFGDSTGAIDLTVNGGTTPYSYSWSSAQTLIFSANTQDLSNLWANGYVVQVTDINGCQLILTDNISQPVTPLVVSGVINDVNCYALNDGAIDVSVTGGTPNYTYLWSNGDPTQDISLATSGAYTVVVTDALGCAETAMFTINQPNAPLAVSTLATPVKCNGGSDGTISSFVSGGTFPYNYLWSNNGLTSNLTGVSAGIYTLTVTDAQGCTAFTGTQVPEPQDALQVVITPTEPSCYGYNDGQFVLDVTGGTQPYYFNWGDQNEILLNNPSETLDSVLAATYLFRIKDANGCIIEQLVTMTQPTPLTVSEIITDVLCFGDSTGAIDLTITGSTPPYSTSWSNGQNTEDATNLMAGEYTYTVGDNQGCEYRSTLLVEQPVQVKIDVTISPVSCIDQTDGQITVAAYGGVAPYAYAWNTGQNTPEISDLAPGVYVLTVTDANSCVSSYDLLVDPNSAECVGIPNTFSPNGDNYNDTWILENLELYPNAKVSVFNKWGNLLYETSGAYTPWDGTHHSKPLPSEVYYYIIQLGNPENNEYTGTITIVR
jgi:gliding motility-associated-like protein